jgi:cytoskeletal protein RodZ
MARGIFGERLKRERELREVTPEEITSATRIGPRFLNALENEEWEKLPGGIFNRGFVRSIARYLGLDEEALLAEYDLAHGAQVPPPPEHPVHRIPSPPRWLPFAVVIGIVIILIALVAAGRFAWRHYQARKARQNSVSANAPKFPTVGSVLLQVNTPVTPSPRARGYSGTIELTDVRQAQGGNSRP